MTTEIAAYLVILIIGVGLFAWDHFPSDVVALGLMLTLVITGLMPAEAAFQNFGSNTVLTILGLLVMTEGLIRTGVVDIIGGSIQRRWGERPGLLRLALMVVPGSVSSIMNNTAAAAFFLPITLGLANRAKLSPSKLLMPMAFATILGGALTLIGTSTNLVVSGLLEGQGFEPIGLFELTPIGIPVFLVGILYMYFVGYRLIPDRAKVAPDTHDAPEIPYFSEITILPNSPWIGKTIEDTPIINDLNLGILQLYRNKHSIPPLAETILQVDDRLMVEGRREDVLKINQTAGIEIHGSIEALDTYQKGQDTQVAEVMILPGSRLIGRSIKGLRLRERYKIQILAITQHGQVMYSKLGRRVLKLGDMMLIQVPKENLNLLQSERLFQVLDVVDNRMDNNSGKAWLSVAIFLGAVIAAGTELIPTAAAMLLGALIMFLLNLMSSDEAYRRVEWRVLIVIGSMLAFGKAMETTGTADYLADHIIQLAGDGSKPLMLTVFFVWSVILTQMLSNQAAAAVTVPVAIRTALLLDWNPRPLAMMIVIAATCSFVTPLEPACVLVYGAGKYRFLDFTKVGFLLTFVIYAVAIIMVPMLWEF